MANLKTHQTHSHFLHCSCNHSPKLHAFRNPNFIPISDNLLISGKIRVSNSSTKSRGGIYSFCCFSKQSTDIETVRVDEEVERPPFDINLAVILAGFAFEAYKSPPESLGKHEVDSVGCQTVLLSESFLHEIYDGQLFVKLKKGYDFPAMDPWFLSSGNK